ncbi:MAG: TonB-dependent receptor [Erythrobacter sp.]
MNLPVKLRLATATALSAGVLVAAQPAMAQVAQDGETAENENEGNVIIVTARGRDENLIDVPISETVFTSEDITDANIERVDDFIGLTPGVTISNSQDSGTNFITIRGLSQTRNGEPPVAVVIDGVLQVDGRSFDQPLFDVDSIEVLRGPQGALYGRNATSGAIIINTRGPSNDFEGYIQAGYGRGDDISIEGSIAGPIVEDTVLFRLSAQYRDFGGIFENVILDEEVDFVEEITVRGHLQFNLSDRVTADLRGNYSRSDGGSLNFTYQPAVLDTATGLPTAFDFSIGDADQVSRQFFANNLGSDVRDVFQVSLRVNVDLDFADLLFTSSYDNIEQLNGADQFPYTTASTINPAPPFPFFDGTQTQFVDIEAFSQEIRLTSKNDLPFRWAVGAYYLQTDRFISSTVADDLEQGIFGYTRTAEFVASNPLQSFFADDNDNEAWAVFVNLAYDITDSLELAVSGRYDEDSRVQNVSPDNGFYTAGVFAAPAGIPGAVNTETFEAFQPKVSLRYNLADNASVYASWGRGFRSGQFNQNGVGAAAAAAIPPVIGVTDVIDEEISETLEAGFKVAFLNGRINASGAVYNTDLSNAPYFVFIGSVGAQVLVPIEEVDIFGVEFEGSANIADGLDIYAGVSVTDAEIQEYSVNPAAVGNDAPYVPSHTINLGVQYRQPLSDTIGIFARADYENRGEQFWDPENTTSRSNLDLLNLRFGFEDLDGAWSLTGTLENATDEVYNSEFVIGGFAHAGQPRIWKVDFRYNF